MQFLAEYSEAPIQTITDLIVYIKVLLDCDWLISVQLIPNSSAKICNHSAIFCNHSAIFCNHSAIFCNHSAIFCNHSAIFCNHGAIFCNHSAIFCYHYEPIKIELRFGGKMVFFLSKQTWPHLAVGNDSRTWK